MRLKLFTGSVLGIALLLSVLSAAGAEKSDKSTLEALLSHFLANTEQRSVHDAFWADDLIYTSSSGTRQGKSEILSGFDEVSDAPAAHVSYAAEDVTIRVWGDMAITTFRLVAHENGARTAEFFNTGVFRRHGESWKAFTWQATKIPAAM